MRRADLLALRSVRRCPSCGAWITAEIFQRVAHQCWRPPVDPEDWRDSANCKDVWPDAFFDEADQTNVQYVQEKVCGPCPVKDACLATALRNGEQAGIWGGMTTHSRRLLARRVRVHARRTA